MVIKFPPPTLAPQVRHDSGDTYDLECVEIRERLARNGKFRYCRVCTFPSRVKRNTRLSELDAMGVREDDGKFSELRSRGHES